eukprot:351721-Chlamydomonas_euryale.AAC.5
MHAVRPSHSHRTALLPTRAPARCGCWRGGSVEQFPSCPAYPIPSNLHSVGAGGAVSSRAPRPWVRAHLHDVGPQAVGLQHVDARQASGTRAVHCALAVHVQHRRDHHAHRRAPVAHLAVEDDGIVQPKLVDLRQGGMERAVGGKHFIY